MSPAHPDHKIVDRTRIDVDGVNEDDRVDAVERP